MIPMRRVKRLFSLVVMKLYNNNYLLSFVWSASPIPHLRRVSPSRLFAGSSSFPFPFPWVVVVLVVGAWVLGVVSPTAAGVVVLAACVRLDHLPRVCASCIGATLRLTRRTVNLFLRHSVSSGGGPGARLD